MTAEQLVRPIDMSARYGDGIGVGLSLGGGGVWFVAWQVAYLFELSRSGIDLAGADRVVGTSAGSLVASVLEAGNLGRMHAEMRVLARVPKVVGALAPAGALAPSQERLATCSASHRTHRRSASARSATRPWRRRPLHRRSCRATSR
jgi:NTE family protein